MRRTIFTLSLFAVFASFLPAAIAADWGNLSGQIIVDGKVAKPKAANVNKDQAYCGKHGLVDESVVVSPKGELRNAIVWLYLKSTEKPPAIHESYAKAEKAEVLLDNMKCRFTPHAFGYRTGQTLVVSNSDPVGHSSKIEFFHEGNPPINPNLHGGTKLKVKIGNRETLPAQVQCGIHPWMSAWILVQDHPYFAVTDAKGRFSIKNLPAGKWRFRFWHEKPGYLQKVTVNGTAKTWIAGRASITIKPGENDLGVIKVKAAIFSDKF